MASTTSVRQLSEEYVANHKLEDFFQHILSLIVHHRPDDPRQFIIEEIDRIKAGKPTPLIDESDLDTMFDMLDITRQRTVSGAAVIQVLQSIAASVPSDLDPEAQARWMRSLCDQPMSAGQPPNVLWVRRVSTNVHFDVFGNL
eukprot:TRINITY_DN7216_c0_g1_i2.p1 TRINITY_DN7216_c0_g1~~TRINITY_DN7216_c0_g1_i2.p1  ORF type:complete len:143 (+),score=21.90 TRINITY_DN7216_c0_g1_i2:168-596(+)